MADKLNIRLLSSMDLITWFPPTLIPDVAAMEDLLDDFGQALRILEEGWDQEVHNTVQVMKSTIDGARLKILSSSSFSNDERVELCHMIDEKIAVFDRIITATKQSWTTLGYNPTRKPRRRGRRRG
jgi:hypothetical protein